MRKQITNACKTSTILVLILSFLSNLNVDGQEFSWNKKTSMLYPMLGQSVCFYDGKIYVTGGSKDGALHGGDYGDPFLQIYNIPTSNWDTGTPMPTARWMHGSAEVNSVIYCIGGGWYNPLGTNEAYDIASKTWTTKAPMPHPRSSLGVAAIGNKIYAIGGFGSSQMYNINEMYDPQTNTWTTKAPMPIARTGFGTTVVNGKIYVVGGCTSPTDAIKRVEVYDPQTDTWQKKADMPTARFGLMIAPVGGKIYAMGGTPSNTIPSPGKVEVYDIETDTWEILPVMPDPTQWGAAGSWGNKVYILGGEDMCLMTYPQNATIHNFLYESSDITTGIWDENYTKKDPFMIRVYPNPFGNETTLRFVIPNKELVKVELYNAMGKKIQILADNLNPQEEISIVLNGANLSTGIYFCKLSTYSKIVTIKLVKM